MPAISNDTVATVVFTVLFLASMAVTLADRSLNLVERLKRMRKGDPPKE